MFTMQPEITFRRDDFRSQVKGEPTQSNTKENVKKVIHIETEKGSKIK